MRREGFHEKINSHNVRYFGEYGQMTNMYNLNC